MRKLRLFSILLFLVFLPLQAQVKIALSLSGQNYVNWLKHADNMVIPINMYDLGVESAVAKLDSCSALLLTGGEDVYPGYYGKLDQIGRCETINGYRDTLEMALIQRALDLKMPIFGICRGEQILNVALGGTLTIDIPSDVDTLVIHRCPPGSESCLHDITIDTLSQFFHITGISSGVVNSYHHQAAERTAPGMRAVAFTANGVTEVIEREDPSRQPFLMGVQFHPERLVQNPSLAEKLAVYFVKQAMDYDARRDKIVRD